MTNFYQAGSWLWEHLSSLHRLERFAGLRVDPLLPVIVRALHAMTVGIL